MKSLFRICLSVVFLMVGVSVTAQDEVFVDSIAVDTIEAPLPLFITNVDSIIDDRLLDYRTCMLFMPLVFDNQQIPERATLKVPHYDIVPPSTMQLDEPQCDEWLLRARREAAYVKALRYDYMVNYAEMVKYNRETMPKAPKEFVIVNDPTKQTVTIIEKPLTPEIAEVASEPKLKRWKTSFTSAIQFSQIYVSPNWYQGGTSSLNLLSDQLFTFSYNDPSGKLLFENLIQWKFNLTTSAEDTVHSVRVSEDLFQINSKFGYKAFGKWYYSASLLFKTQLLTNYEANSNVKQAEFFSPGEFNLGIGMSYSHSYEKPVKLSHTLTIAPLSYNMRFVAFPKEIDPQKFGIDKGNVRNDFGSSLDYTLTWDLRYNIRWMSHIYAFTNYKTALIEWTNAFDFSFSSLFSARVYLDMRFDNSVAPDPKLGYLQLKELLSIGFSYKI